MHRKSRLLIVAAALMFAGAAPAGAGEFSFEGDVTLVSSYIWRGIEFDDRPSLQPSLTVGYAFTEQTGVSVNAWWNFAIYDHDSDVWRDQLFEQDLTLTVSHRLSDDLTVSGGVIDYRCPKSDVTPGVEEFHTDEVFVGADMAFGSSSLTGVLFYDFDDFDSFYLDLSLSHGWSLSERLALTPGVHVGFAEGDDSWFADDGIVDARIGLAVAYDLAEHVSFGA